MSMNQSVTVSVPKAENRRQIGYVDFCRWLATFMVVLCHTLTSIARHPSLYGLTQSDANLYMAVSRLTNWAVPAFLMISGLLYLDPARKTDYRYLLRKPVRRLLLALAVFGIPMCLIEELMSGAGTACAGEMIGNALIHWISGEAWDHMWYLYMLPGLLLMVPLVKNFILQSDSRDAGWLLAILFLFTSVLPTLEYVGFPIGLRFPIQSVYLLYFVLGYYIEYRGDFSKLRVWWLLAISVILGIVLFLRQYLIPDIEVKYAEPVQVLYSISIFCLIKKLDISRTVLTRNRNLCFTVYLIHPFFLNVSYKVLHLTPAICGVYATPLLFAIAFFAMSIVAAQILMWLPPLKKYVL